MGMGNEQVLVRVLWCWSMVNGRLGSRYRERERERIKNYRLYKLAITSQALYLASIPPFRKMRAVARL